jgi:hypothetical protein
MTTSRATRALPLIGESPKVDWWVEIQHEDSVHALIAFHTGVGKTQDDGRWQRP